MTKVVAQILRSPAGGIRKHVLDIIENLSSMEIKQIFITNIKDADLDLSYLKNHPNVEIYHVEIMEKPGFYDILSLIRIYKILKNKKVNILHGHGAKGGMYSRLLSGPLGASCIYTPHGGSLHRVHGRLKNKIYDFIELVLMPLTDVFLFESHYSANEFAKNIKDPGGKKFINYNGVDIPENYALTVYHDKKPLKLASFGLLRFIKGHDIFIETCKMMKEEGIDFFYAIYGNGEMDTELKSLIDRYGLDEQVKIYHYSGNVYQEMLKYDFIVHPSRFESFGYVPVEAMSIKVPVIVSHEGGLKEVVTPETGYISLENTPESYLDIMEKIYNGDIELPVKIEKAYERVKKEFSKSVMLAKINQVYRLF